MPLHGVLMHCLGQSFVVDHARVDGCRQVTLQTLVGKLAHLGTLLLHVLVQRLALPERQDVQGVWVLSLLHDNFPVFDLTHLYIGSDNRQGVWTKLLEVRRVPQQDYLVE